MLRQKCEKAEREAAAAAAAPPGTPAAAQEWGGPGLLAGPPAPSRGPGVSIIPGEQPDTEPQCTGAGSGAHIRFVTLSLAWPPLCPIVKPPKSSDGPSLDPEENITSFIFFQTVGPFLMSCLYGSLERWTYCWRKNLLG